MMLPYVKNYFGAKLSEDDYQNIPHPYVEMYTHVTLKTVQLGTTFSTVLFGPLIALARKDTRNMAGLVQRVNRASKIGIGIGLVVGPVMTYKTFRDQSYDAVWDRAYRMRKNQNQIRCDRGYIAGAATGLTVSLLRNTNPMFGSLVGMSAGLISMGLYNNQKQEKA